jgi:hypothetical protein
MNNVPVLHNTLPSLSVLAYCLNRRHALRSITQVMEISISNYLSPDETTLKVGVGCACCLWCQAAFWDRPTADFFLSR